MKDKITQNQWMVSEVIDTIACELDAKSLSKALDCFTADAGFRIEEGGKTAAEAKGTDQIREVIAERMAQYDILFHLTGTKVIDLNMSLQKAHATSSALVKMINSDPSVTVTQYVDYDDHFILVNDRWYLADRIINIISSKTKRPKGERH